MFLANFHLWLLRVFFFVKFLFDANAFFSVVKLMSIGSLFLTLHSDLLACFGFCKIKYAGADTDTSMASPPHSFCRQISREEFEQQSFSGSQGAIVDLLENIIQDKNMSIKDKKKKLKQVREDPFNMTWGLEEYLSHGVHYCMKIVKCIYSRLMMV